MVRGLRKIRPATGIPIDALTFSLRSRTPLALAGRSQQPGGGGGVNRKSGGIKQAQLG
jgi:hypothetical protein